MYKLRHINKSDDINIISVDSTYQFLQCIQSDFGHRKHTTNMHKHTTLIKIHIWLCGNGQPFYAQYIYGDGYHADGKAFAAALNKDHLKKCKQALIKKKKQILKSCSFTNLTVISELEYLQSLINLMDHIISDNGYHLRHRHPALKSPAKAPANDDEGGQVTCIAAAHKRGCMAIRNGHERSNGYFKRHAFCRCRINTYDMHRVPEVWNIVLADMIHFNIELTKDDANNELLAKKIIDMERVTTNPIDIYHYDQKVTKKNK